MNKIIWTYWAQGFENSPELIQRCVARMKKLHPDWTIHLLTDSNVWDYIDDISISIPNWNLLNKAHQSDIIRTKLLIDHGGVWIDPTVFCIKPLDSWLPSQMKSGLFMFSNPGRDRLIGNWFISSESNNRILIKIFQFLLEYWRDNNFLNYPTNKNSLPFYHDFLKRYTLDRHPLISDLWLGSFFKKILKIYPYMVYHFTYAHVIRSNKELWQLHKRMPKILAKKPLFMAKTGQCTRVTTEYASVIDHPEHNLFKLNWKVNCENDDSILSYLLNKYP